MTQNQKFNQKECQGKGIVGSKRMYKIIHTYIGKSGGPILESSVSINKSACLQLDPKTAKTSDLLVNASPETCRQH